MLPIVFTQSDKESDIIVYLQLRTATESELLGVVHAPRELP